MSLRHEALSTPSKKMRVTVCGPSVRAIVPVYQWTTVVELKQCLRDLWGIPTHQQTLSFRHVELPNAKRLADCGVLDSDTPARIMLAVSGGKNNTHIQTVPGAMCDTRLRAVVGEVAQAFAMGLVPTLTDDGTGGTYFLRNPSKDKVAVFKPIDEEPFCPNNPRQYIGELGVTGLRRGVLSGEAAFREVAAYLLDYEGFSAVPETCLAEAQHKNFCHRGALTAKQGSFQSFVKHNGVIEDYSPTMFSRLEVQKIAILDLRVLNLDRNEANILVQREAKRLIPIDHGLSLPDCFEVSKYDLCWMSWPQAKEPLALPIVQYVSRLDPLEDIRMLRRCLPIRDRCLRNMRISGLLLKKGVEAGLSLFDIGSILYRNDDDVPSVLEKAVANAEAIYSLVQRCTAKTPQRRPSVLSPSKEPRPRALSANNETELYFGDFLRRFEPSTAESDFNDSPQGLGAIDEEDEEAEETEAVQDLPKAAPQLHRRTRSTPVAVLPEQDSARMQTEEAFDEQLFHYIEAFLEQEIQRKVTETKKDRNSESRVRSKSLIQFDF